MELLLDYTDFKCSKEGRFRKMIHQDTKNSTTLPRHPNPVHTQGHADNSLRSFNAFHEDGHKFDVSCCCTRYDYPNNSHAFDEVSYESEKNTLSESIHDQKSDAVLIDANFSDDPLPSNYIFNRFEENISGKPKPDVISYFIYPHNALASCGKLVQCEALVLNEFDFD
ncbi:unnamed protein product [Schistosoma curassoni]|uniref:Uncharacterized protein n=1 Tax=Schistosoma curassoni TaxID=6186 RepID=A0A183KQY1_9TREM|nr:unnamed protein product [Schistosoma curassoni]